MKKKEIDLFDVLSQKWVFSSIMAVIFYSVHFRFSEGFFQLSEFTINILNENHTLIQTAEGMELLRKIYVVVTLIGIFLMSVIFYISFLERFLYKKPIKKEIDEEDVQLPPFPWDPENLQLIIGLKHRKFDLDKVKEPQYLVVPSTAMYQNFLITGTIGTGKTASVMYSFLKQAMFYQSWNPEKKAGMLILDVKGNFYKQLLTYAEECGRSDDVVLIHIDGKQNKYNPLHKPHMEAVDLAERSRYVIDLFSAGAKKEAFWNTKAGQMMTECIRLMRLTNNGYVTLADVNALVTNQQFLEERLERLYEMEQEVPPFDFYACTNYFLNEFSSKAETTIATIKSCVTEMTGFFASSEKIHNAFCPNPEELSFKGFEQVINQGKIVVLAMNAAKYPKVAKTIAAYLKMDFQSEVEQRTADCSRLNTERPVFFISDEYQTYVTANDAAFYGLARESKCCSIVSSQSYTSILQTLGNKEAFETLHQNLVNKIWLRTDDELTVKVAQFLTGKEEKERYSKNISESTNDAKKSKVLGKLTGEKSSISESINVTTQRDFVFEERIFTQTLKLFKAVAFTANAEGMNEPFIVHLLPYFKEPISQITCNRKKDKGNEECKEKPEEKERIEKEEKPIIINLLEVREKK
ncbi:type IV secretory system conjugative DNA transfer family protein [Sinanaerobacter sp. ZZT-01]|uniref:type IV secretory system conjugative DNA transfer family protein n=1 Tax=Sinanaerobacter sp. ZZT-01 TaxID=3111540 RepID=UPI002D78D6B5|nr:type IV secretion system DNA-binding domain-containing protein [Sinanaerobacter sp. ZZT-01]WRR93387.1 type IV secretion system DNA-binding domain-containing protein [Sinanaerobacter sp. ZZT-01]